MQQKPVAFCCAYRMKQSGVACLRDGEPVLARGLEGLERGRVPLREGLRDVRADLVLKSATYFSTSAEKCSRLFGKC